MSKYRFKRVEKKKDNNVNDLPVKIDIEDDSSKTRNFPISSNENNKNNDETTFFNPFVEDVEEKRPLFSLRSFIKGKDKKDEDEVAKKLDDIFTSDVMSVEDIKNNLSEGKPFDLTHVFDKTDNIVHK